MSGLPRASNAVSYTIPFTHFLYFPSIMPTSSDPFVSPPTPVIPLLSPRALPPTSVLLELTHSLTLKCIPYEMNLC